MKLRWLLPLIVFVALATLLAVGLTLNPREVPSPFIGKPAPAFSLPQLHEPDRLVSPADLKGQVWLLNVWASWCVACRDEHALLVELSRQNLVPIYGLNYKDESDHARAWLERLGNPYVASLADRSGRTGIDYGVYGVPETFLVDKAGVIRFKHIGPVTREIWLEKLLPLVQRLKSAA